MILTGFDGVLFSSIGVTAKVQELGSLGPQRNPVAVSRLGGDPYAAGIEQGLQTLRGVFDVATGQPIQATMMRLLALLNPDDPTPRTLTGTINGVAVETTVLIGPWGYPHVNEMGVDLILTTPGWRATATTSLKTLAGDSTAGVFANSNTGYRDVYPTVTVYWPSATNRPSGTATFGWRRKIAVTITNTGTEPLINQPYQLGPIDTAAWVSASQMQADGDDLRVFFEGSELRRNLIGANTRATLVWVVLPDVAPGQAITLDLVTDNPSAGSPPTLTATSTPPLPAMDIGGTSFKPTSVTSTTVTLSGAGWETNQWAGATLLVAGASGANKQMRSVSSNTADTITFATPFTTNPALTDDIVVTRSGLRGNGRIATGGTSSTLVDTYGAGNWWGGNYAGMLIEIIGGTGAGQRREIVSVSGANTFNVTPNWTTTPTSTSVFRIYAPNGNRLWDTRTSPKSTPHKGLWSLNKSAAPPSKVDFDAPGSWYRFAYERNRDTYSQPRYASYLVGAGNYDHFSTMYIQRSREGKRTGQREIGVADAIGYATPFPITAIVANWTFRNATKSGSPGEGMCEMRIMVQESGGDTWSTAYSDLAEHNTSTPNGINLNLSGYGSPNRVAFALVPNGQDEIDETDNNTALLAQGGDYLAVMVNSGAAVTESVDWFMAPPALTACYDLSLLFNTGGAAPTPPYHQLVIGGPGRRLFIGGTNERVVVDGERRTASIVTAAGALVRRVAYAVAAQEVVEDDDGTERTLVASRWLPIPSNAVDADAVAFSDPSGAAWGTIEIGVAGRLGYLV